MTQKTLADYSSTGSESGKVPCPTCGDLYNESGVAAHHWQAHGEELKEEVQCDYCGETLQRKPSEVYDTNFCNDEHMYAYQQGENHHNYNSVKVPCENCGSIVERNKCHVGETGPFCNHDCYGEWLSENWSGEGSPNWQRVEVECDNCAEEKQVAPYKIEDNEKHFCNAQCRIEYSQKHSHAPDLVTAVRRKLSGVTWTTVARSYRKEKSRDCEMCGASPDGRENDVHHMVPIVSGGWNGDENLITACRQCHEDMEAFVMQYPEFDPVLVE